MSKRATRTKGKQEKAVQLAKSKSYTLNGVLLTGSVASGARKLKEGTLKDQVIKRVYGADDLWVMEWLRALNKLDENRALRALCNILRNAPMRLEHPYIWDLFEFLWASPDISEEFREKWVVRLVAAWAEGMTVGWRVRITKPSPRGPGRQCILFPKIAERDGWLTSDASREDKYRAGDFIDLFDDLHARLKRLGGWRSTSADYEQNPEGTLEHVVGDVRNVFEQFKKARCVGGKCLDKSDYRKIAHQGLNEKYKKDSITYEIACQLMATLTLEEFARAGRPIDSGLIHKTLETLKKHHFSKDYLRDLRLIRGYATAVHGSPPRKRTTS